MADLTGGSGQRAASSGNIFASYSHKDVEIVRQFEHHAKAFGDRYLRDAVDLRSGQVWNDELMRMGSSGRMSFSCFGLIMRCSRRLSAKNGSSPFPCGVPNSSGQPIGRSLFRKILRPGSRRTNSAEFIFTSSEVTCRKPSR